MAAARLGFSPCGRHAQHAALAPGVSGGGLNFYVHGAGVDEMIATYDNGARGGVVGWYLVVADYAGSTG